jgi:hypothetical protein
MACTYFENLMNLQEARQKCFVIDQQEAALD